MASGTTYEEDRTSPTYTSLQACLHYSTSETDTAVNASWYGGVWYNWSWNFSSLYHSLGYDKGSGEVSKANSSGHSVYHGSYDEGMHDHYNGTPTESFPKGHNAYNVYLYSYCRVSSLNSSYWDSQAEYHFTVPALAQYTIVYNTNTVDNVSSMPSNQTKWYGEDLPLSSSIPIRGDGSIWEFIGWDSNQNATTPTYPVNQTNTYTANNGTTLYAIWKLKGHWITYNTQGGMPVPSPYLKTIGTKAYITSIIPKKERYQFKEWNTAADGSGTKYSASQEYNTEKDLNLYAIWEKIDKQNLKFKNSSGQWMSVAATDCGYDQLNTAQKDGLVSAGGAYPNCVWATDTQGNPGWYAYAETVIPDIISKQYVNNYDGSQSCGTIILEKYGRIVCMTLNWLHILSGLTWNNNEYSNTWSDQPQIILPQEFQPIHTVHMPELIRPTGYISVRRKDERDTAGSLGWHDRNGTSAGANFWDTFMWIAAE